MPFASKQWPVSCIATININIFFIYHLWVHMTLQMSNYSYSVLCLYLPVDLWNWSLSAAQCGTAEFECMNKKSKIILMFAVLLAMPSSL